MSRWMTGRQVSLAQQGLEHAWSALASGNVRGTAHIVRVLRPFEFSSTPGRRSFRAADGAGSRGHGHGPAVRS